MIDDYDPPPPEFLLDRWREEAARSAPEESVVVAGHAFLGVDPELAHEMRWSSLRGEPVQ